MPLQILIQFAQAHPEFRIPELLSVAATYGFVVVLPPAPDVTRPFMAVELQKEEHAYFLAERCILVKSVHSSYVKLKFSRLSIAQIRA